MATKNSNMQGLNTAIFGEVGDGRNVWKLQKTDVFTLLVSATAFRRNFYNFEIEFLIIGCMGDALPYDVCQPPSSLNAYKSTLMP